MKTSVVIRSKDEAPRLMLTLTSLIAQDEPCEIVVVDDGSSDGTPAVIAEMAARADLAGRFRHHRNETPHGRSAASNMGAELASGDILLFLDGDTLAAPDLVSQHQAVFAETGGCMGRGATWHLRQTRPFIDPEAAIPFPDQAERVAAMSATDRDRKRVTREQIVKDFASIAARGQPGIYPGAGPRLHFEAQMAELLERPLGPMAWEASSGANQSVPRQAFLEAGGFDAAIDMNEHREMALRLVKAGARMAAVPNGRTFHMTHQTGWRNPLKMSEWENLFFARFPICEVPLLYFYWASFDQAASTGPEAITSLDELQMAAARCAQAGGSALATPSEVRALHLALSAQHGRASMANA